MFGYFSVVATRRPADTRPDSSTRQRGNRVVKMRLTPAVRAQLERAARERGVTVSALVRGSLLGVIDPTLFEDDDAS